MRLLPLLLVALVLAACGNGGGGSAEGDPDDLVVDTQSPGGPDWVKSTRTPEPGEVIAGFVEAAIAKDFAAMWSAFSTATKGRIAPDLASFQKDFAKDFAASVGAFVPGKYEVVDSFTTGQTIAVASIAGTRLDPATKKAEYETFGSALVREEGAWKLELFAPVQLTLVVPEERIVQEIPRVAVAAEAGAPILEVGVWIDGKQYPSPTEGASPTQMTIFSEPDGEKFPPGNHTVLVLASIGDSATATSWTFRIES